MFPIIGLMVFFYERQKEVYNLLIDLSFFTEINSIQSLKKKKLIFMSSTI